MKNVNVVLNLGLVTRNFIPPLKIEIYDTTLENAIKLARKFARTFNQECVAVTYKWSTVFVDAMATMDERKQLVKRLSEEE